MTLERKTAFIVHGAIRKRTTRHWMKAIGEMVAREGYQPIPFMWSGLPLTLAVRWASRRFIHLFQQQGNSNSIVFCKSVGADIVNMALGCIKPERIINIAPAYRISTDHLQPGKQISMVLKTDRFLDKWERRGLVHRLPCLAPHRIYILEHGPELDHHNINQDQMVTLAGNGQVQLYGFYRELVQTRSLDDRTG
jgi:hypothetical protein